MNQKALYDVIRLKYIALIEMGQSPPSTEYTLLAEDGLPFLQGTADFGARSPTPMVYCSTATKVAQPNDILFSVRAPVGELNIADQLYGIGRGLCAIQCQEELLIQRYAWWALHWARSQLAYLATGSTYEAVAVEDVGNLEIPTFTIDVQQTIADVLEQDTEVLDTLIAAKHELLELLAEKRQALITQAVTRGLDAGAPLRDSGVRWLGDIPVHWEVTYLRPLLQSMDYGISESVGNEGAVAVLRMGDIYNGSINFDNVGFVDEVSPYLLLRPGDLLFNRTNSFDQVGKVGLFPENIEFPVTFASYLVRMRCTDSVLPAYFNYVLNSPFAMAWAKREALPSIGQVNLNPNRYSYLTIPIPPMPEQIEIVKFLDKNLLQLESLETTASDTIALLQERRSALIAAAVTGQLEVTEPVCD